MLLAVVDRGYPSSKTCSACGVINAGLMLSQREWEWAACGTVHARDKNAATNILAQSLRDAVGWKLNKQTRTVRSCQPSLRLVAVALDS